MAGYTGSHNAIQTNYFQFVLDKVPNLVYFCQAVNLPGIQFGTFEQPTILSHPILSPVGSVRFEELVMVFKVDEELKNWLEIHNWILEMSHYIDHNTIKPWQSQRYGGKLLITNSAYKPKFSVSFRAMFPISLSGIPFATNTPDSTEALATVKFGFSDYTVEKLVNP